MGLRLKNMTMKKIVCVSSAFMLLLMNPISLRWFVKKKLMFHLKIFFVILTVFYMSFSAIFFIRTLKLFQNRTNFEAVISLMENVAPNVIAFFISLSCMRHFQLQSILAISSRSQLTLDESKNQHIFIILKLLIISTSKFMQMLMVGESELELSLYYGLSYLHSELILRATCESFVFYVNCATEKLEKLRISSRRENGTIDFNHVQSSFDEQLETVKKIEKFYSNRLFSILIYDIFQLIVSLYWIFIRIVYNHVNWATFAYLPPPLISLYSIFSSSQKFEKSKRKLISSLIKCHKNNELSAYKFCAFLRYHNQCEKSSIVIFRMIPMNFRTSQMVSNIRNIYLIKADSNWVTFKFHRLSHLWLDFLF